MELYYVVLVRPAFALREVSVRVQRGECENVTLEWVRNRCVLSLVNVEKLMEMFKASQPKGSVVFSVCKMREGGAADREVILVNRCPQEVIGSNLVLGALG